MINDYNIYCEKYRWDSSTALEDVNFFSTAGKTLLETINLRDYTIELGNLSFSFENVDENNNMYFEDSDINITVKGLSSVNYFEDFFEIYTNNIYIKHLIKIYNSANQLLYTGIVNLDRIKQTFTRGKGNRNIVIQALGMLKEFKNYYSTVDLPASADINWIYDTVNIGGTNYNLWHRQTLTYLFSKLITIATQLDSDLSDWYISKAGHLEKSNSLYHNYTLIKCSYELIVSNGENVWGFISKLCSAMGWTFFIYNGVLKIINRSIQNTSVKQTLDYNKLIPPLEFSREGYTKKFDSIIISDGLFYGGAGAGFGDIRRCTSLYIFNNTFNFPKENTPWYQMTGYYGLGFSPHEWVKYKSKDDDNTILTIVNDDYEGHYGAYDRLLKTKDILFIDGGNTGGIGCQYDVTTGVLYYAKYGVTPVGDTDIYFQGNYGDCLFRRFNYGYSNQYYYTYQDYMQTDLAKSNFNKFLYEKNVSKCKGSYKEAMFNPMAYFDFTNKPDTKLDGEWKINNMKVDLNKNITELELQIK